MGGALVSSVLAQEESRDSLAMPTTGMENLLLLRLTSNDLPCHACVHSCFSTGSPVFTPRLKAANQLQFRLCLLSTYYMHDYTSALEGDTLKWVTWFPSEAIKVLKVPPFGRGYTVKCSPDRILSRQTQCGVQEPLPFQWRLLDEPLLSEAGCEHWMKSCPRTSW